MGTGIALRAQTNGVRWTGWRALSLRVALFRVMLSTHSVPCLPLHSLSSSAQIFLQVSALMVMIVYATATHVGFTNRLLSPAHIFPTNTRTFVATFSGSQCCCIVPQVCGGLPRGFSFLSVGVARKSVQCSYLVHTSRVSYFISRRSFTQFLPLLFTNPYKFRVFFFGG